MYIDNVETSTKASSSSSRTGTTVGIIFGVVISVFVVTMFTLFILKRNGRITSYLPSFFMKKNHNTEISGYTKQKDSELVTIVNKNFN